MSPRKLSPAGDEFYRVRVVLPGALLQLASADEPTWLEASDGRRYVDADWLDDPEKGDSVAYIDWAAVRAVTYRYTGIRRA